MSFRADLTADLAFWIAGLIREYLTDAPPPRERNTVEWLLGELDQAGLATQNQVAEVDPAADDSEGGVE